MSTEPKYWLKAVLGMFLCCPITAAWVSARSLPPAGSRALVVSVADNSATSNASVEKIMAAIGSPLEHADLYSELGSPIAGELVFGTRASTDGMNQASRDLEAAMASYVKLYYASLEDAEDVLRSSSRATLFNYAEIEGAIAYSATPNDTFFPVPSPPVADNENFQWASQNAVLGLPAAWDRNTGWAHIGVLDQGLPVAADPSGVRSYVINHLDLQRVISYNSSWNFGWDENVDPSRQIRTTDGDAHGSHVVGLIAANSNNNRGIAGACWNCSVQFIQPAAAAGGTGDGAAKAMVWLSYWGSQVVNYSGYQMDPPLADNQGCAAGYSGPPLCLAMKRLEVVDAVFVASAGNGKRRVNFPARDSLAIAVGGIDVRGNRWDELYPGAGAWLLPSPGDYTSGAMAGCPIYSSSGDFAETQCGSNFSYSGTQQLDFVAPARRVLSTVPMGSVYDSGHPDLCNDSNFGTATDGYALCSGTSMSAPLVSGVIGLLRSVNPLLPRSDVYAVLKQTASGNEVYSETAGWGRPDAGKAVERLLGKINGATVANRITPMFALRNTADKDRLYTTRPQIATGAFSGLYLAQPQFDQYFCMPANCNYGTAAPEELPREYVSASLADANAAVAGFPVYPDAASDETHVPVSAFWVFTSDKAVWPGVALVPLLRLSLTQPCDWRQHVYVTLESQVTSFLGSDQCSGEFGAQPYQYDGIEGYVLSACPPGYNCDNPSDPTAPQKLFRRYSSVDQTYALLLQSQLSMPAFSSYCTDPVTSTNCVTSPETAGLVGYAFPNVDTDNDTLPDGFERMYGLNPGKGDSDCDGRADGFEFSVAGIPRSDPLDSPTRCASLAGAIQILLDDE